MRAPGRAGARVALVVAALLAPAASRAQSGPTVIRSDSLPAGIRPGGHPGLGSGADGWGGFGGVRMRVHIQPSSARIGQALTYRGSVLVTPGLKVRFEPPRSGGPFTWSQIKAGRAKPGWMTKVTRNQDSVWFEARLQIFESGRVTVQGPVVQLSSLPRSTHPGSVRLPVARVTILPTVTEADSGAQLRALHGPLRAPWWERIGWVPLGLALLLLAVLVQLVRRLRKRKPAPVVPRAAPAAPVRARLDPAAEALRALAALRARELPQAGRFSEHAFELTAILRRFLEITITTPRPGDTSGELLERLRSSRMPEDDYDRLEGLLSLWDRVKFARAPLTEVEAARCEEAVEAFVRRIAQERAAAAARAAAARAKAPPASPPTAPEPA